MYLGKAFLINLIPNYRDNVLFSKRLVRIVFEILSRVDLKAFLSGSVIVIRVDRGFAQSIEPSACARPFPRSTYLSPILLSKNTIIYELSIASRQPSDLNAYLFPFFANISRNMAEIVDVRLANDAPNVGHPASNDIPQQIIAGLLKPTGEKCLPTLLLYDERGLRLYDDITTSAPEYYLFGAEEEILKNNADDIVKAMHSGGERGAYMDEVVLELGAGWVPHSFFPNTGGFE